MNMFCLFRVPSPSTRELQKGSWLKIIMKQVLPRNFNNFKLKYFVMDICNVKTTFNRKHSNPDSMPDHVF